MFKQASEEVELNCLSLMSLYSETHPTVSYIVHYGINVVAPVYKLQVCILCYVPLVIKLQVCILVLCTISYFTQ